MKTPLKSIIVSLSSLLLILISTTHTSESCGFSYRAEEYRVSFFMPEVLGDDAFQPFFYTAEVINSVSSEFETDKQRNLKLWQTELGKSVALSDIDKVLYADSDAVVNAYNEKKLKETFGGNTFVKALLKPKNKAILEYLIIAKQNEFINFAYDNPWEFYDDDYGAEELRYTYNEPKERKNAIAQIETNLKNAKSAFLKQRYAYLQLVNYRYSEPQKGLAIFEKYFDINNEDVITAWAIFHTAACISDRAKANYYLSLAFDKCDSKKARCYLGFDGELEKATLELAKSDAEKATIFALANMNTPAPKMDLIQKVYALDNENSNLKGLILREISKIEDWLLTPKITGMPSIEGEDGSFFGNYDYNYNDETGESTETLIEKPQLFRNEITWKTDYFNLKNYQKDLAYSRQFRAFLEGLLIKEKNKTQQDFFNLAISHLYFLDNQPQKALAYNAKVSGSNAATKTQQEINKILLLPLTENITMDATKTKLYQSLQYLQNNLETIKKPLRTVSQLHLYLSKMYYRRGDVVTAAFFHQKAGFTGKHEWSGSSYYNSIAFFDRYGTIANIENAIQLLEKKQPSDFEKYFLEIYSKAEIAYSKTETYNFGIWDVDEDLKIHKTLKFALIDLQGTIAFRQDKLNDALAYFKKLPADYWRTNYDFSYYLNKNPIMADFIWDENNDENEVFCNKIKILEDLIALKTKAEKSKNPSDYQKLGNAYYNFTYWGNAWMMFSYGHYMDELDNGNKSGYWSYSFYPNAETYFGAYYGCDRAANYYQKALNAAKNDTEAKAKAAAMLAYCKEMKRIAISTTQGKSVRMSEDYLASWKKEYKNTETAKMLAMSCSSAE